MLAGRIFRGRDFVASRRDEGDTVQLHRATADRRRARDKPGGSLTVTMSASARTRAARHYGCRDTPPERERLPSHTPSQALTVDCADGGRVSRPPPLVISADGAGQRVSGTADRAGHSATATVTLNIDGTPPARTSACRLPGPLFISRRSRPPVRLQTRYPGWPA